MRSGSAGLERAALGMLRTLGAGTATLVTAQPEAANDQTGLGFTTPPVNEAEIEPVLLHTTVNGKTLLAIMTRCTAEKAMNSAGGIDVKAGLAASMLRAGQTQYRIVSVTAKRFGGAELLYELEIEE